MRTTVIPAQITTVEDKIAGNLNLTQILLLIFPVFWTALIFAVVMPFMTFTIGKVILITFISLISTVLAIRIKGKVLFEWLFIIARFNLRPGFWIYNKNEIESRTLDHPIEPEVKNIAITKSPAVVATSEFSLNDIFRLDNILQKQKLKLRFRANAKGGLHVALGEIAK